MNNDTLDSKKKQKLNMIGFVLFAGIAMVVLYYMISDDSTKKIINNTEKNSISHSINSIEAEEIWREESANKMTQQAEETKKLKNALSDLTNQIKTLQENQTSKSNETLDYLTKELKEVKQKIEHNTSSLVDSNVPNSYMHSPNGETQNAATKSPVVMLPPSTGIYSYKLKLTDQKEEPNNDKTIDNYLPIGAFGRAVILGGVDASTSLTSQSDPRPVLMRLLDHGRLPKNVRSKIKDCHVIGAGYGDISSERVYVRLETISCTTKMGEIFEKPIHGYVAGADGKDGIRGRVVWREGPLVQRAFMAGTLGEIGQGVADTYTTTSVSPLGVVETVDTNDIFQAGLAQGGSSALDRLAEYNIERAEAYQPIIEVNAGQIVEIVINHEGLYLRNPTLEEAQWTP